MKANLRKIRKKRVYTDDYKREIVALFESGEFSVKQIVKLYGIGMTTIYNWIYKFSIFNEKGNRVVEKIESSSSKLKELEQKVKQLEQIVGKKQIMIDYLEKLIDLAKDELQIDIKKNCSTELLDGSGQILKKGTSQ